MPRATIENPAAVVHAVNLRIRGETRSLIDRAAKALGRTRSDFMIEASRKAAEDTILDQSVIAVDPDTYDRFLAALDRPPEANTKLRKTMQTTPTWEKS